jgi:hypothetical protein
MPKPQKRDNTYYLERLKREHPKVYADLLAGKFPSALKAFEAAGLKGRRTRLQELKNAWQKATVAEQRDFLAWARARSPSPSKAAPGRPIAIDRKLEAWAKARIDHIASVGGLAISDVMTELGLDRRDTSLSTAMKRGTRIQDTLIAALEKWLASNESV